MAPSRFAANAVVGSALAANRFAKMTFAAMIGTNASRTAVASRARNGRERTHDVGTTQDRARPPNSRAYIDRSGGTTKRRVTSTTARTATSTPAKTKPMTRHLVAEENADPGTLFISSSKEET